MPEQDLKDNFANDLLLMYKLLVISNHDLKLVKMIDILFKKEDCINKLYNICSKKSQVYEKKDKYQILNLRYMKRNQNFLQLMLIEDIIDHKESLQG